MLVFAGLGNPGSRYAANRHNFGFMAVDEIVRRQGFGAWRRGFEAEVAEGRISGQKVLCLKPQTFMNESGRAIGAVLRFYKLESEALFVFYDELDLAPAKLRVKLGGGAGGHNGLRSIDAHIGKNYWRVRMGIGHPGHKDRVHGYVLQDFAKSELAARDKLLDAVAAEVGRLAEGDAAGFMSRVAHLVNPPPPKPPQTKPPRPTPPRAAEPEAADTAEEAGPETGESS